MNYSRKQLEALGEPLGESVTRKEGGRIIYGGGGGGSSAPSSTTQTVDLPDWAKPYAQETLEKAKQLSAEPYQRYDQPRIAGFSPMQQQAQEAASRMGTSGQLGTGTGLATAAGLMGLGAQYQPGYFQNQFRAPGAFQTGQFGYLGAQAPDLQQYQMAPAERVSGGQYEAPLMDTAQTGYQPNLQTFQMGPAERVRTGSFTQPGRAEQYMSPFIEQALVPQLREAQRTSDILGTQQAGQAVQQGAFGGARAGLLEAERQRNLATQMGDIRARGLQTAYEQAQGLYGTEAQRQLAAQQANQQAGLTVGGQNLQAALGVQQLGAQTGLQTALANLSSAQQANVQNQAAQLQMQGLSANQAMQAALANQQAGLTVGQQNLAALLGTQQFGAGQNLQAQLANQQAYQQAQAQREASRQFGYGQQMTAAQQRAQYGQAAQQLGEQSRQFGAGFGQQGLGTALQAAGQLGNLGQAEFGQQKDILGLQSQFGAQQQALRQQGLSQAYQDFLNEQNYPYRQLGFMSDMVRGLPLGQQSTSQIYQAPANLMGQLGGIGMGLYGMSRMAEGGEVQEYADGGSVDAPDNVAKIANQLSDVQLAQAKQAALVRGDKAQLDAIETEEGMRASERNGLAGAFNQLPYSQQEQMMAGGGIVAFSNGGDLGVSPEFGGYTDSYEPPKRRSASEVQGIVDQLRSEGRTVGLSDIQDIAYGKGAFKTDVAKIEAPKDTPKPTAATVRPAAPAPAKAAAPKEPKISSSITTAAAKMADEAGLDRDTFLEQLKTLTKQFDAESKEDMKALLAQAEKSMGGSKEVKEKAIGRALAEFGFKWAASAAQPGAKFIGSAATAAPTLAASMAESDKLAREMDQNDLKLRMNLKQFEIAQRKDDRKTALNAAAQIRALEQNQAQLALKRQELAQQGAYQQGSLANQRADMARRAEADRARGITALANLQRAQSSVLEVGRKAGLDFDNSRAARDLMKQFTEKYGPDKAKYMYAQERRNYIKEATQGARDQADTDVQARSVFDLLGQE